MSVINFNTSNQTFRQLMGNGLTYCVPPFQRDYSWSETHWEELWQDILNLFQIEPEAQVESAHYLGYLVLQSTDNKQFFIIDGQQRLTTLSIMLLASLNQLKKLSEQGLDAEKNQRRQEQLKNSYIGYIDPVSLVPHAKLALNRHNNRFYKNYLIPLEPLPQRGLNNSEHLLRKAFLWFNEHLARYVGQREDSGEVLTGFIDKLVDKLFFTVITVTDELNAFTVFETLNARGVRLSSTDLLKNYLFSLLSNQHESEIKAFEEYWERILGLLGSEHFPEFLRVFWNSQHKLVRKSELFKTIRKQVQTRAEAFSLLRELDRNAAIYTALRDPQDSLWQDAEQEALKQLIMFKVRQPLAMLMACYQRFYDTERDSFSRILRAVAVLSLRYNVICNLPPPEQERVYNRVACDVSNGTLTRVQDVLRALHELYPEDIQFKAAFTEKSLRTTDSRNKKIVRFLLFELEHKASGNRFDFESVQYTIEHILPEHPSDAWSYLTENKQERLIYRLGNLTLLEASLNREIGNSDYAQKRVTYEQSTFQLTRAVAQHYDIWDENKLQARQKQLAERASSIWRINFN